MNSDSGDTVWQSIVWHAPGFIIGMYFLTLQFVTTINLSYLLLLAGAIFLLLAQPVLAWKLLFSKPTALACALFLSTLLSVWTAGNDVVNIHIAVSQIPGLLIYLILVLCVRNTQQLTFLVCSFFVALCIVGWMFLSASLHAEFARSVQLIYFAAHPLFLAANDVLIFAINLPLIIWLARRQQGWLGWLLGGSYVAIVCLLSELLLSRMALLLIATSCLPYLTIRQRRLWSGLFVVAVLTALIYLFDASFAKKLQTLDLARLRTWTVASAMFLDAPVFGKGPGSFSVLYRYYVADMPTAIRFGQETRNIGWAHSLFFESAAEKGLIGLSVVIFYFIYLFVALKNKLRSCGDSFVKALLQVVIMCFLAACFELSMLRVWGIYVIYATLGLVAVFTACDEGAVVGDKDSRIIDAA